MGLVAATAWLAVSLGENRENLHALDHGDRLETLHALVDRILIDQALVNGTGKLTRGTGQLFRRTQSGLIPAYLLTFGFGALVLIFFALLWKAGQ